MKSCHSKSNLIVSCPRLSVRLSVCVSRHVARPHPSGRCMYATQMLLLHFCLWSLTHRGREKVCFAVWGQQSELATSLDRLGLGRSHLHSHSHLVLIFMLSTRIVFAALHKPSELSINPNSIAMRLSDPLRGSASCNCCHSEILHKAQFRGKLRQQLRIHGEKKGYNCYRLLVFSRSAALDSQLPIYASFAMFPSICLSISRLAAPLNRHNPQQTRAPRPYLAGLASGSLRLGFACEVVVIAFAFSRLSRNRCRTAQWQ